jgi:3-hydroxy-3-methylglutaryl CoA synthase
MAVEAARLACRSAPGDLSLDGLWFATANPAYHDRNNASAIHAALRLEASIPAFDFGGALRSGVGALRTALDGNASSSPPTCATGSPEAATRARAATARPR